MKTLKSINNGEDMIDSRDVIARIEYLEEMQADALTAANEQIETIEKAEAQLGDWCLAHNILEILVSEELTKKQAQIADMKDEILSDGDDGFYSDDFGTDEAYELKALKSLADD